MSVDRLVASYLRLARQSLTDAETLVGSGSRNAVYFAEQATEHMIYAVAQVEHVHFGRGTQHQLDSMVRELPADDMFVSALKPLTWLEAYATAYRYPRTKGSLVQAPSSEKVASSISSIGELLEQMAEYFQVDLYLLAETPAGNVSPPRQNDNDGGDGGGGGASGGP